MAHHSICGIGKRISKNLLFLVIFQKCQEGESHPDASHLVTITNTLEGRDSLTALRYGLKTTGMETAAGWWIHGAGDLSLQDDALTRLFNKRVGYGNR